MPLPGIGASPLAGGGGQSIGSRISAGCPSSPPFENLGAELGNRELETCEFVGRQTENRAGFAKQGEPDIGDSEPTFPPEKICTPTFQTSAGKTMHLTLPILLSIALSIVGAQPSNDSTAIWGDHFRWFDSVATRANCHSEWAEICASTVNFDLDIRARVAGFAHTPKRKDDVEIRLDDSSIAVSAVLRSRRTGDTVDFLPAIRGLRFLPQLHGALVRAEIQHVPEGELAVFRILEWELPGGGVLRIPEKATPVKVGKKTKLDSATDAVIRVIVDSASSVMRRNQPSRWVDAPRPEIRFQFAEDGRLAYFELTERSWVRPGYAKEMLAALRSIAVSAGGIDKRVYVLEFDHGLPAHLLIPRIMIQR